ncbi:MAG: hypothetical protein JRD89_19750, partial [Deltaproteobacteria bacterium]|nr:hypothetical protein [Deltaproteobacteria bacterium]
MPHPQHAQPHDGEPEQVQALTDAIGFQISESTMRTQVTIEQLLMHSIKQAKGATHLQGKPIQMEVNLPLFGLMKRWTHELTGDLIRWVLSREESDEEVVVGIPAEDADAMMESLGKIAADVKVLRGFVVGKDPVKLPKKVGQVIAESTLRMKKLVEELVGTVDELALEDVMEEPDEDDDEEDYDPL